MSINPNICLGKASVKGARRRDSIIPDKLVAGISVQMLIKNSGKADAKLL
jgi:uncharacterized protein (DUF433 family)